MNDSANPPVRTSVKILAIFFVLFICLFLAEILVRIIAPHPRYEYYMVADELVGVKYKPNFKGRATNIFGEFDTKIEINQEGFRDKNHPLIKPPHTFRIAFLGDSFTAAEQVEEPESFVRRTETLLNDFLAQKGIKDFQVEVVNFGIGGFEIQQYVLCYENYVKKYKPDLLVMASFVHNDISGDVFYLQENQFGRPYYKLVNGELQKVPADMNKLSENYDKTAKRLSVHWYHHFQLYNAQKQIFWAIRQQMRWSGRKQQEEISLADLWKQAGNGLFRYYAFDGSDPVVKEADEVSKMLLQRLQKNLRDDGVKFRIALLPAKENLFPEKWPEELKDLPGLENIPMDFNRPFQRFGEFLPDMNSQGEILDLRPALRKASETKQAFFPRDSHFNKWGHEVSAEEMAKWLEPVVANSVEMNKK
jgi:hypothetical protein